jgi:hypothetical protein
LGPDFLYLAFKLAGALPHPAEKARARDSIAKALGAAGLPTPGPAIIHITGPSHKRAVTRWLRHEVALVSNAAPLQAMYMRLCSSFVDFTPPSVRAQLFNAPGAFKNFKFDDSMLSAEFIFEALRGSDMLRVSVSAKRSLPTDPVDDSRAQLFECKRWLARWSRTPPPDVLAVSLQKLATDCRREPTSVPLPLRAGSLGSVPHLKRTGELHTDTLRHTEASTVTVLNKACQLAALPGHHATCADKDPSVCWLEETPASFARVVHQLSRSDGRWAVFAGNRTAIMAYYRRIVDLILPRQLRPRKTAIAYRNIPYAYPTVKDKCWSDGSQGAQKTCRDPSHSCLRMICSFYTLTVRTQLRLVSRAVRFLLQVSWVTFELWDLSKSAEVFKSGIDKLTVHAPSALCPDGC